MQTVQKKMKTPNGTVLMDVLVTDLVCDDVMKAICCFRDVRDSWTTTVSKHIKARDIYLEENVFEFSKNHALILSFDQEMQQLKTLLRWLEKNEETEETTCKGEGDFEASRFGGLGTLEVPVSEWQNSEEEYIQHQERQERTITPEQHHANLLTAARRKLENQQHLNDAIVSSMEVRNADAFDAVVKKYAADMDALGNNNKEAAFDRLVEFDNLVTLMEAEQAAALEAQRAIHAAAINSIKAVISFLEYTNPA